MSPISLMKNQYPELFDEKDNAIPAEPANHTMAQLEALGRHIREGSTVKDPNTTTVRNDGGKNRVDLLPTRALERVAEVLTAGLSKYPARNWEPGMAWSRCYASALRHLFAWWRGEDRDPETGLSHLAHCACNILFLLEYEERKRGTDDRPK